MLQTDRLRADDPLVGRCAALGVPLLRIDTDGVLVDRRVPEQATVGRLIADAPLLASAVHELTDRLESPGESADPIALWPGCWLLHLPTPRRRRGAGRTCALLLTTPLLDSEQFVRIVDEAGLDLPTVRRRARTELHDEDRLPTLACTLVWMAGDLAANQQQEAEIDSLSQHLAETYEELSLVFKLSSGMTVTQEPAAFLAEAIEELQEVVNLRWMAIVLRDGQDMLAELDQRLVVAGDPPVQADQLTRIGRELMPLCVRGESPPIIDEPDELPVAGIAALGGGLLAVPLACESGSLGLILGGGKRNDAALTTVDSKLVTSLAESIGIFLENLLLYEAQQSMFMGTLRSLVNAIDAKDTYTCGHSERVAWLGRALARQAGLPEETCHRVYLAGLLHDVGKIGIPEAVLCKPGRLTDEEFEIIKAHPRIGARIVGDISQMSDLIPGVLYHHERYDGRGYPDGLAGERIPLFGRLLCLADSFDAMSSSRTYRRALPLDQVLEEVRRCAGTQFDPDFARVFVDLDFDTYQRMVEEHQQRRSVLRRELDADEA
jgi:HD-GYP domain-containing protein (c-di-GMP phosphodiesterase class II)